MAYCKHCCSVRSAKLESDAERGAVEGLAAQHEQDISTDVDNGEQQAPATTLAASASSSASTAKENKPEEKIGAEGETESESRAKEGESPPASPASSDTSATPL